MEICWEGASEQMIGSSSTLIMARWLTQSRRGSLSLLHTMHLGHRSLNTLATNCDDTPVLSCIIENFRQKKSGDVSHLSQTRVWKGDDFLLPGIQWRLMDGNKSSVTLYSLFHIQDWIELSIQRRWGDSNKGSSFSMLLIALTRLDLALRELIHILRPCLRAFYAPRDNSHHKSLLRLMKWFGGKGRGGNRSYLIPQLCACNKSFYESNAHLEHKL